MSLSFIVLVAFIQCIAVSADSIQDQIGQLSIENQEKILRQIQSASAGRDLPIEAAENWCCRTDPGVQAVPQTRLITYYVSRHGRHRCGYTSCGFLGWSSCTRWCSETWAEQQTAVETYLVYVKNTCPDELLTCCAQHIFVLGHCFSYEEIYNNHQALAQLSELGIVIPGPSVG